MAQCITVQWFLGIKVFFMSIIKFLMISSNLFHMQKRKVLFLPTKSVFLILLHQTVIAIQLSYLKPDIAKLLSAICGFPVFLMAPRSPSMSKMHTVSKIFELSAIASRAPAPLFSLIQLSTTLGSSPCPRFFSVGCFLFHIKIHIPSHLSTKLFLSTKSATPLFSGTTRSSGTRTSRRR